MTLLSQARAPQDFNLILLDQFLKGNEPKVEMMYTCNVRSFPRLKTRHAHWAKTRAFLYLNASWSCARTSALHLPDHSHGAMTKCRSSMLATLQTGKYVFTIYFAAPLQRAIASLSYLSERSRYARGKRGPGCVISTFTGEQGLIRSLELSLFNIIQSEDMSLQSLL